MALNKVGTPGMKVTLYLSTASSIASASGLGIKTLHHPQKMDMFMAAVSPYEWKKGRAPRAISCPSTNSGHHARACWQLEVRFLCVSSTPFGNPRGASRIDNHGGVVHMRRMVFRYGFVVFQQVRKFVHAFPGWGLQMKTLLDEWKKLLKRKWEVIADVTRDNLGDSRMLAHLHQSRH